jgi:dTDP-4-amino-4,6-dideoxygalactose transaminase
MVGYNSRLDEIQAAILRVKLPHLDQSNAGRRRVAHRYNELLGDVPGVVTPYEADYGHHVYHQYTVRITGGRRDQVKQALNEARISTMVYYPTPVHCLPVYQGQAWRMPSAEVLATEVLSLPIWPQMAEVTQEYIVNCLRTQLA